MYVIDKQEEGGAKAVRKNIYILSKLIVITPQYAPMNIEEADRWICVLHVIRYGIHADTTACRRKTLNFCFYHSILT